MMTTKVFAAVWLFTAQATQHDSSDQCISGKCPEVAKTAKADSLLQVQSLNQKQSITTLPYSDDEAPIETDPGAGGGEDDEYDEDDEDDEVTDCLDACHACQEDEDVCLWDYDNSQTQDFATFSCDDACHQYQDYEYFEDDETPKLIDECEGHEYNSEECEAIAVCHFDEGQCWYHDKGGKVGLSEDEAACELHGYKKAECEEIAFCVFDEDQCWYYGEDDYDYYGEDDYDYYGEDEDDDKGSSLLIALRAKELANASTNARRRWL